MRIDKSGGGVPPREVSFSSEKGAEGEKGIDRPNISDLPSVPGERVSVSDAVQNARRLLGHSLPPLLQRSSALVSDNESLYIGHPNKERIASGYRLLCEEVEAGKGDDKEIPPDAIKL